jgi:hypothetical protein
MSYPPQGVAGITRPISPPLELTELVAAVCSETEASAIAAVNTVIMASNAEAALILEHPELTVAKAATICESAELTTAKAALVFDEAGLTADRAASIFEHANLTVARTAFIFDHSNLTVAKAASIFDEVGLSAQKAADIFDHVNLTDERAIAIFYHANLSEARQDAIRALMTTPEKVTLDATLPDFQATPATGTFTNTPENINDNNIGTYAWPEAVGQYAEVDFGSLFCINQWRIYGYTGGLATGRFKIEYYDDSWHNWVIDIPSRGDSWSSMSSEDEVLAKKIRLTCTTYEPSGRTISELEVYHS